MSLDLSSLSRITTTATALSNLILVSPQEDLGILPQTQGTENTNPPKFLFNYYGENTVLIESDITDHFVEDNTALQDQIALRPELITGQGFIGELTDITPDFLLPLRVAADKLTVIGAYTPELTLAALLAYNTAFQAFQVAQLAKGAAVSAWNSLSGDNNAATPINAPGFNPQNQPIQTKQQLAFSTFYGYWKQRRLFTVQTPWAIFQNCALKSLRAIQDGDSRMLSNFDVTFKPINFAKTSTQTLAQFLQGRARGQALEGAPVSNGDIPYNNSTPVAAQFGSILGTP